MKIYDTSKLLCDELHRSLLVYNTFVKLYPIEEVNFVFSPQINLFDISLFSVLSISISITQFIRLVKWFRALLKPKLQMK